VCGNFPVSIFLQKGRLKNRDSTLSIIKEKQPKLNFSKSQKTKVAGLPETFTLQTFDVNNIHLKRIELALNLMETSIGKRFVKNSLQEHLCLMYQGLHIVHCLAVL